MGPGQRRQCEAWLRSGRAFLLEAVREIWEAATKSTVTLEQRANLRIAATHGSGLAAQISTPSTTPPAHGATTAPDPAHSRTSTDHAASAGRLGIYEMVGADWLGLPIDEARLLEDAAPPSRLASPLSTWRRRARAAATVSASPPLDGRVP